MTKSDANAEKPSDEAPPDDQHLFDELKARAADDRERAAAILGEPSPSAADCELCALEARLDDPDELFDAFVEDHVPAAGDDDIDFDGFAAHVAEAYDVQVNPAAVDRHFGWHILVQLTHEGEAALERAEASR